MSVRQSAAWQALQEHFTSEIAANSLSDLFQSDATRFTQFSTSHGDLLLDYSKQRVTGTTMALLCDLLHQQDLASWIERLFAGAHVNESENRAALHSALRAPQGLETCVDGVEIGPAIQDNLTRMEQIVDRLHRGHWRGFSGKPIIDVVNLGVGGSDLGPHMVCHALEEFRHDAAAGLSFHFVSSIDGSQLAEILHHLNQETTLFIFSSKSFTTIDTLANAETARQWLATKIENPKVLMSQHFIGCSAKPEKMSEWGIPAANQLQFWDWVGGRYSLWSVIGLPIALLLGMPKFREFLQGAHEMDCHFRDAPLMQNIPVLMALMGIWNGNFVGVKGHAILPYDGRLKLFPAYLGQLEMESNGKSVTRSGESVDYDTCPILWGEVGPNAQHAFYQLLHQGTQPVYCDFLAPVLRYQHDEADGTQAPLLEQQQLTLANCLAQSRVLMLGDHALDESQQAGRRPDQCYSGNQPSTTLLYRELTPKNMGALIALYENKVFVESVVWEINPFDQWGVELGKQIANKTHAAMQDQLAAFGDASTDGLLAHIRAVTQEAQG